MLFMFLLPVPWSASRCSIFRAVSDRRHFCRRRCVQFGALFCQNWVLCHSGNHSPRNSANLGSAVKIQLAFPAADGSGSSVAFCVDAGPPPPAPPTFPPTPPSPTPPPAELPTWGPLCGDFEVCSYLISILTSILTSILAGGSFPWDHARLEQICANMCKYGTGDVERRVAMGA